MSLTIIQQIERDQINAVITKRIVPEFAPGDTVKVMVKVFEGLEADPKAKKKAAKARRAPRDRASACRPTKASSSPVPAAASTRASRSARFPTARAWSACFPIYSPYIAEIEVLRRGKVRRAKLYYLRGRRGKSARIFERTDARAKRLNAAFKGFKKPKGEPDNLTEIKGLNAELAGRLNGIGVIKFEQIANFSDDDIANVDETLSLGGRIEKDDWVSQAQRLLAEAAAAEVPAGDDAKPDDKAAKKDKKKG